MFSDFPNLHPLVVHFPIVLLLVSAALQSVLVFKDFQQVKWITLAVMAGGFAGALAASTFFHAMPMDLSPQATAVFAAHEQFASYTTWLSGITLLLRGVGEIFQQRRRLYEILVLLFALATAVVLSVAGHRGAQLVYVEGVGPQGKLLMKGDHHGHQESPGQMPDSHLQGDHPRGAEEPRLSTQDTVDRQAPMPEMKGMDPATPMDHDPQATGHPRDSRDTKAEKRPMPAMPGMPSHEGMSTSSKEPVQKSPKSHAMPGMESMPDMEHSQNKKPTGEKLKRDPLPEMESMPDMEHSQNKKSTGHQPESNESPAMPGMVMPNPLDTFRFKDNNPSRTQPKETKP